MESFRFIHTADLHLDSPFRGLAETSPGLRDTLQSATLGALNRVVDHTINSKADFLIIAGDLYDSKDRSLRALVSFRKQMERLAERHIPVFIVHGNHDPLNGWGSGFQLPPNVVTFGGHADTEPFIRRGRDVAHITGVSYMRERVTDNLSLLSKYLTRQPILLRSCTPTSGTNRDTLNTPPQPWETSLLEVSTIGLSDTSTRGRFCRQNLR